jgi:hypothetical protein
MAINFPDSPTIDQIFDSGVGKQYIWNGNFWNIVSSQIQQLVTVGPEYPQESAYEGQLFYNTTNGRTAIYFDQLWKEFSYITDIPLNGGSASTLTFDNFLDNGVADTLVFSVAYDGGQA